MAKIANDLEEAIKLGIIVGLLVGAIGILCDIRNNLVRLYNYHVGYEICLDEAMKSDNTCILKAGDDGEYYWYFQKERSI